MSSKNSRVKIHVGGNQKSTAKNSRGPWLCSRGACIPGHPGGHMVQR
nr:MAG TPA: hypothetical protein [Caudoviricetes sp.]